MEDFQLDLVTGSGPGARSYRFKLNPFTLIGATTRAGLLTAPLRDRFGIIHRLNYYTVEELVKIVKRTAKILGIEIKEEGAVEIAKRSRGTPRIANRLLRRVRDFAEVKGSGVVDFEIAEYALDQLEIDKKGLDEIDRKILKTIIENYGGGPVGLNTLSASISEDKVTIEELYEPYLLQIGFIERTARGRVATELAYNYFGLKYNKEFLF